MSKPVSIIMIEDDEGHARLIERNIRRSGVNNEIVAFKAVRPLYATCSAAMAPALITREKRC